MNFRNWLVSRLFRKIFYHLNFAERKKMTIFVFLNIFDLGRFKMFSRKLPIQKGIQESLPTA